MEGSGLQWPFSSKTDSASQILSFRSSQGQSHTLYPPGSSSSQIKSPIDMKAGNNNQYPVTALFDASVNLALEVKAASSPSPSSSSLPSHKYLSSALSSPHVVVQSPVGQNVVNSGIRRPRLQSVTASSSSSYKPAAHDCAAAPPPSSPIVGFTDLSVEKPSSYGPSQMTIFYNGLVCVYDDIAPEKAQAIMLLAGNGKPTNLIKTTAVPPPSPTPPTKRTSLFPPSCDGLPTSNKGLVKRSSPAGQLIPDSIVLNSGIPGSLVRHPSCSSQSSTQPAQLPSDQPEANSISSNIVLKPSPAGVIKPVPIAIPIDSTPSTSVVVESNLGRPVATLASPPPVRALEPPKATGTSPGAGRLNLHQSGLPQARSASLQRFLEKRKERVIMSGSPYGNVSKGASAGSNKGNNDDTISLEANSLSSESVETAATR